MSGDNYSGPYCIVKVASGDAFSVQGSRSQVTGQLREHESGLVVLMSVYGDAITVGTAHVVSVEQLPTAWGSSD